MLEKALIFLCTFTNPKTNLREINWECVDEVLNCKLDDEVCLIRIRKEKEDNEEDSSQ